MPAQPRLKDTTLDLLSRTLADAVTHNELTMLLAQCDIEQAGGGPKWQRILLAVSHRQRQDGCGNNALSFLCAVLHPSRFASRHAEFEDFRAAVNFQLTFYGLMIDERGGLQGSVLATTLPEATRRANELRAELQHRSIHPDVLRYCREELLQENYFHCILEATKSVAQRVRDQTGVEKDGAALIDLVFSVSAPRLALNSLRTESEQSEQKGFAHLLKGVFGMYRNVTAHAPKVSWMVNRIDALDALTMLSSLHRRLDEVIVVPQVAPPPPVVPASGEC